MRWIAIAALLLCHGSAHAYVRTRSTSGVPLRWPNSCVTVTPDSRGSVDLPTSAVFADVRRALENWRYATVGCSYLQLLYGMPLERERALGDGVNVVRFLSNAWCTNGDAAGPCYDPTAQAVTTVFYYDRPGDPTDGVITGADIELNNVNFTFVDIAPDQSTLPVARPQTLLADLENTLTHELGHLQGLSDSCARLGLDNQVDETGSPPPSCNEPNLDPKILNATMYPIASPASTAQRTPEADDIAGICADNAYPLSKDPNRCEEIALATSPTLHFGDCALSAGRGRTAGGFGIALSVLLCALAIRRRSIRCVSATCSQQTPISARTPCRATRPAARTRSRPRRPS